MISQYRPSKLAVFTTLCLNKIMIAYCSSLLPTFYSMDADKADFNSPEYLTVLIMSHLTMFVTCPLFGNYINFIGSNLLLNLGVVLMASSSIVLGVLAVPVLLQFLFGLGKAAFTIAYICIIGKKIWFIC